MTVTLNLVVDQKEYKAKLLLERNWIEELILMLYQSICPIYNNTEIQENLQ